jgi:ribosomal protein S18 acetylase RimI-like enzyme/predicted RNase H-like HicB family nuclease
VEEERPIRVWLEPSYDHGRTGAWLIDWPGAFTWGEDRETALARVPSAVHRFVGWLADHGEVLPAPSSTDFEVVEEVPAFRLDSGYEVNATFAADQRPVTSDELEDAVRRLGYARDDLLELIGRVREFEAAGGRLPMEDRSAEALESGASVGRQGEEVLRHLAGSETWFASRLDPSARYDGPARDGPLAPFLESSREFFLGHLRGLAERDPATAREDGKGERWTLAKLLRRAVYHSLDHLEELDRRLAMGEGRAAALELRFDAALDFDELRVLFAGSGLRRRARDDRELTERMVGGSTATVSAWDGERLIGFARIISDEATNGYISTVAVAPRWQDRGLGTRLMRALMDGREDLKLTLDSRPGTTRFYERLGFRSARAVMVRARRSRSVR